MSIRLERQAYATADAVFNFLNYAPCELVHMKGSRYGAIPIINPMGGVTQKISDYLKEDRVPGIRSSVYDQSRPLKELGCKNLNFKLNHKRKVIREWKVQYLIALDLNLRRT